MNINKNKNGMLLAYIVNHIPQINLRKLLKIVYLIDERFLKERGFPLTWFNYYAWAKGPVAPDVYAIKNGAFSDYVIYHSGIIESFQNVLMDEYSPYELNIIDEVISECINLSADQLTDITHNSKSLWSYVVNENNLTFENDKKSDVLLPLIMISSDKETYEDALEYMQFCNANSKKHN